jgi:hypothetical protein
MQPARSSNRSSDIDPQIGRNKTFLKRDDVCIDFGQKAEQLFKPFLETAFIFPEIERQTSKAFHA